MTPTYTSIFLPDHESEALVACNEALAKIEDQQSRSRVVAYLQERWGTDVRTVVPAMWPTHGEIDALECYPLVIRWWQRGWYKRYLRIRARFATGDDE